MKESLSDSETAKHVDRLRKSGWLADRRWRKFSMAASSGGRPALAVLTAVALDTEHARQQAAADCIADYWARHRTPELTNVVVLSGGMASTGFGRLLTAALHKTILKEDGLISEESAKQLMSDSDARVVEGTIDALKVLAASADDDRSVYAGSLIAAHWAYNRDPELRELVLATRATAPEGLARLATCALHGTLADEWNPITRSSAELLLRDPDEQIRSSAISAIAQAPSADVACLWPIATSDLLSSPPDTAVAHALVRPNVPPPQEAIDALWTHLVAHGSHEFGEDLHQWGRPGGKSTDAKAASKLLLSDGAGFADMSIEHQASWILMFADHANTEIATEARRFATSRASQDVLNELMARALSGDKARSLCIELSIAPRDISERAKFYLLTNQPDQYRQVDLDGSLMALVYEASDPTERKALQQAMLSIQGLNLVQAIVGADRRTRIQRMSSGELDYLVNQLGAREDWAEIWRLALDLPLATAVRLVATIDPTKWRPSNPDDASLFDLLAATSPDSIARGLRGLANSLPPASKVARIRFHGRVNDLAFSPHEPELAVGGSERVAGIVDLVGGRLKVLHHNFHSSVGRVLHLGNDQIAAGERTSLIDKVCRLVECGPSGCQTVASGPGSITALALGADSRYVAGSRAGTFWFRDSVSGETRKRKLSALGLQSAEWPRSLAVSQDGASLTMIGSGLFMTDGGMTSTLASTTEFGRSQRALMTGDDGIILAQANGRISLVRRHGRSLTSRHAHTMDGLGGIGYVADWGQIVAADARGRLQFLSDQNLEPHGRQVAGRSRPTGDEKATSLTVSPRGDFMALGFASERQSDYGPYGGGFVEIYDLRIGSITSMASRPLLRAVPGDLAALGAVNVRQLSSDEENVITLLTRLLEHRFRFDIIVSDMAALAAGEYDIYLEPTS